MVGPAAVAAMHDRRIGGETVAGAVIIRRDHRNFGAGDPPDRHRCRAVDGAGQDEAAIIVGMLADEIDPAGRLNDEIRLAAERCHKGRGDPRAFGGA